jgi:hypothetical protein
VAVIGGSDYPINNALSPSATGCDIIVPSEPEFAVRKATARAAASNRDEKKSFGNNGLFPQMIALHHPLRHLPRVRLDASQSADSGNYYFFVI